MHPKALAYLLLLLSAFGVLQTPTSIAQIVIEELQDIDLGQIPPTARRIRARSSFCVAIEPRGAYQIIGVGDGPGADFSLSNGVPGAPVLSYQVFISDRGNRRGRQLYPNIPLTGLRGKASRPNGRCPRPPVRMTVEVPRSSLQATPSGYYTGSLRLTVAPE